MFWICKRAFLFLSQNVWRKVETKNEVLKFIRKKNDNCVMYKRFAFHKKARKKTSVGAKRRRWLLCLNIWMRDWKKLQKGGGKKKNLTGITITNARKLFYFFSKCKKSSLPCCWHEKSVFKFAFISREDVFVSICKNVVATSSSYEKKHKNTGRKCKLVLVWFR